MSLKAENISYRYKNGASVLSDISFTVENGESVFILGPNGTGKTTLLKCLCGILKPESGSVSVDGDDISRMSLSQRARNIGYVPQSSRDVFGTEAIDIIMLGLSAGLGRRPEEKDRERVFELVGRMHIEDLIYKKLGEMSGGERQRIFIARALAQYPRVLVLDEPTSALDIKNQLDTMELVSSLARNEKISVVMSVHDINLAAIYADKIMFIKDSVVCGFGTPKNTITEEKIKFVYGVENQVVEKNGMIQILFHKQH